MNATNHSKFKSIWKGCIVSLYSAGSIFLIAGILLSVFQYPVQAKTGLANGNPSGASLEFDGSCGGNCTQVKAKLCNTGSGDMTADGQWAVYLGGKPGNPQNGQLVGSGSFGKLNSKQCTWLTFDPQGVSGKYIFWAGQPEDHPGNGGLWSGACEITCTAPSATNTLPVSTATTVVEEPTNTWTPTQVPSPTETNTPTEEIDPTDTPTPTETSVPTSTDTPTVTATPTDTVTPTSTPFIPITGSDTPTVEPTETQIIPPSATPTKVEITELPPPTATATNTDEAPTPTATATPTVIIPITGDTPTPTPTATNPAASATPTATKTGHVNDPTATPTFTPIVPITGDTLTPTSTSSTPTATGTIIIPLTANSETPTATEIATLPPPSSTQANATPVISPVTGGDIADGVAMNQLLGGLGFNLGIGLLGFGLLLHGLYLRFMK